MTKLRLEVSKDVLNKVTYNVQALEAHRAEKDVFFRDPNESPLLPEHRAQFQGLSYFAPDTRYNIQVVPNRFSVPEPVLLATSSGTTRWYLKWGTIDLVLPEGTGHLELYTEDPEATAFFVPFLDATNGRETYAAGRYLEATWMDPHVTLDFNWAYHPYCLYSPKWTCPRPTAQNTLGFPVYAGEKL